MRNYENVNILNEIYLKLDQIILCNTKLYDEEYHRLFLLDHVEGLSVDEYLLLEGIGNYTDNNTIWKGTICKRKELLELVDKNKDDDIFWNQVKLFLIDEE